jgi:hypothetical protein
MVFIAFVFLKVQKYEKKHRQKCGGAFWKVSRGWEPGLFLPAFPAYEVGSAEGGKDGDAAAQRGLLVGRDAMVRQHGSAAETGACLLFGAFTTAEHTTTIGIGES